jgi:hypothetical protein
MSINGYYSRISFFIMHKCFRENPLMASDHRFQHIVRVLTVCQTAKVIDPPACFGRNPFDAVSAEFVPVVGDNIVLDIKALENGRRLGGEIGTQCGDHHQFVLVLGAGCEGKIIKDALHQDDRPVLPDIVPCLVNAVKPASWRKGELLWSGA